MHVTEIWNSNHPVAVLIRIALLPLSIVYAVGWEIYLLVYRFGLKRAYRSKIPVIVVGNLVTGGSGKSPIVLETAGILADLGFEVVIGCSGYGSPHAKDAALAPDGELDAHEWGDEPAMIRWLSPQFQLVVGRNRVSAAKIAETKFPNAVLLMDDGFQHLPLAKDVAVVLDELDPHNRWCLPAGPYREPRWNRARATIVIPDQFQVSDGKTKFYPKDDAPASANLLCALGQPEKFKNSVESAGVTVVATRFFPDHDLLDAGNLWDGLSSDVPIIVTAKDWVKLRRRADVADRQIVIALQDRTIEPHAEFRIWLKSQLDEIPKSTSR